MIAANELTDLKVQEPSQVNFVESDEKLYFKQPHFEGAMYFIRVSEGSGKLYLMLNIPNLTPFIWCGMRPGWIVNGKTRLNMELES